MSIVSGILLGSILGFLLGTSLGKRELKEWRVIGRIAGLALTVFTVLASATTSGEFLNATVLFISAMIVFTIFLFPSNGKIVPEE